MAIDPSIALRAGQGIPQFDPIGAATKGLSLRELATRVQYQPQVIEQELAASRASTAQIEQATAERERQYAGSRRMAEIVKANTAVDPKTGKITKDNRAIAELAAAEGLPTEVVFKYTADAVRNDADQFKTDADKDTYLRNQAFLAANLMRNAKTPEEAIRIAQGFKAGDSKVVGDDRAGNFYSTLFGQFDANVDPREAARNLSTSLSISELQERGLIPGGTSTQQLDPKSKLNNRDRALLRSLGISAPEDMTREQMLNLPGIKELTAGLTTTQVTSTLPTVETRERGMEQEGEAKAERKVYTEVLGLQDKYKQAIATRPGMKLQEFIDKFITQSADRSSIQGAIDDYNVRNPNAHLSLNDGVDAVFARLRQQDAKLGSRQTTGKEKQNITRFGENVIGPRTQAELDKDRGPILQREWLNQPKDRPEIEREMKRLGIKPPEAPKGSAKGTIRNMPTGTWVKLNDGPDNVKENWKKQ